MLLHCSQTCGHGAVTLRERESCAVWCDRMGDCDSGLSLQAVSVFSCNVKRKNEGTCDATGRPASHLLRACACLLYSKETNVPGWLLYKHGSTWDGLPSELVGNFRDLVPDKVHHRGHRYKISHKGILWIGIIHIILVYNTHIMHSIIL
jgi:hypothetical protein